MMSYLVLDGLMAASIVPRMLYFVKIGKKRADDLQFSSKFVVMPLSDANFASDECSIPQQGE